MPEPTSPNQPSPGAAAPANEPGVGRGCLTVIVVAVVLAIIVTLAAAAGRSKPPVESAGAYIAAHDSLAVRVRAAGAAVHEALRLADREPLTREADRRIVTAATAALAQLASVRRAFATKPVTGTVGDAEVETYAAVSDLDAAITSIATQAGPAITPTLSRLATPATLAGLTARYENAVGEWNDAVEVIWRAGLRSSSVPTIP
jgi:hypothetical protein